MYSSDGASRERSGEERLASAAAVLQMRGEILARVGQFLGNETNNVAEYYAVRLSLRHALTTRYPRTRFRVDSLLVAKQLNGEWACRAAHLQPMYEECLRMLETMRKETGRVQVLVEHVYREFNGDADGAANETLDNYRASTHMEGVVMDEGWLAFDNRRLD